MKIATKKPKAKKTALKIDTTKYAEISANPPIRFSSSNISLVDNSFDMIEGEFQRLAPRLIHDELIGWKPKTDGEKGRRQILIKIYVTDGIRTIASDHKIMVALSYFVRHGDSTWKSYDLCGCFRIINGIRLEQIKEVKNEIKWEARELKEAAAQK